MTKVIEENENVKKIVEIENEIFYDIANQHGRNIESEKDVNKFYEKYQKEAKNLTEAQRTQREEAIINKEKEVAELRRNYFGPEGEMAKKQASLLQPIEDEIYEAVKAIALQQGYAAVLDRASATSLIFASPDIDISNEVLIKLGYSN